MKKQKNIIKGGYADNMTVADLAKKHNVSVKAINKELKKGIKVEMEHTNNKDIAKEIAMDHIFEIKNYYQKLEKMENLKGMETITLKNYNEAIKDIDISKLPEALKSGHAEFDTFKEFYNDDESIKEVVDLYLNKLNEYLSKQQPKAKQPEAKQPTAKSQKPKAKIQKPTATTKQPTYVNELKKEIVFIKRFVNFNGKTVTKKQILSFYKGLTKSILKKEIRKTSPFAKEIMYIQDTLIDMYEKSKFTLKLSDAMYNEYKDYADSEKVMLSIVYLKRYVGLAGKDNVKEKAKRLLNLIQKAIDTGKIPKECMYMKEINTIIKDLKDYIDNKSKSLAIEQNSLNGLTDIIKGSAYAVVGASIIGQGINMARTSLGSITASELANIEFKTIGLKGRFLELIGDPCVGFSAMVHGLPKQGKSTLCLMMADDFADYGEVLFVAQEEGIGATLQEKMNRLGVISENITILSKVPTDYNEFGKYHFVFIDSVNKAGLTADDLTRMTQMNPETSFIFIMQSVKGGSHRGSQEFAHDVDVIVSVDNLEATASGRFAQGNTMKLFS